MESGGGRKPLPEDDELSSDVKKNHGLSGKPYYDTAQGGPIRLVQIGDKVVDSTGKEVGTVKFVKMGDPNAATTEGQWRDSEGFLGLWGDDYDISQLSEQAQRHLMRVGFIHIDIPWAADKFAGAGQIERVEGNTVFLNVTEDSLL